MRTVALVVLSFVLVAPASLEAWGFAVHRFIVDRAISSVPEEIRPFYERSRGFLVEYSVLPDLLRRLGMADEPPRHFLDLDAYGEYPFDALPRDRGAAERRFGRASVEKNGLLPWRTEEIYGELVHAFERLGRLEAYAIDDARLLSAVLAHYVADAHVPFHAVVNYDGQVTGQRGIHARFESELFERYHARLRVAPPSIPPVRDARRFVFDTLLDSFTHVEGLLAADRRAADGRAEYDDVYFDRWFREAQPVLERRLSQAIAATAAVLTGAWEQAGRPAVPVDVPRRPRRVGGPPR